MTMFSSHLRWSHAMRTPKRILLALARGDLRAPVRVGRGGAGRSGRASPQGGGSPAPASRVDREPASGRAYADPVHAPPLVRGSIVVRSASLAVGLFCSRSGSSSCSSPGSGSRRGTCSTRASRSTRRSRSARRTSSSRSACSSSRGRSVPAIGPGTVANAVLIGLMVDGLLAIEAIDGLSESPLAPGSR